MSKYVGVLHELIAGSGQGSLYADPSPPMEFRAWTQEELEAARDIARARGMDVVMGRGVSGPGSPGFDLAPMQTSLKLEASSFLTGGNARLPAAYLLNVIRADQARRRSRGDPPLGPVTRESAWLIFRLLTAYEWLEDRAFRLFLGRPRSSVAQVKPAETRPSEPLPSVPIVEADS